MTQFSKEQLDDFAAKIRHLDCGMLTVCDGGHRLRSRPLTQLQVDEEGQIWFLTSDELEFTRELSTRPHVNVSFADNKERLYISVAGQAELLKDRKKAEQLWKPAMATWLPGGVDDPHLTLIKVAIESAEYWDMHSSGMAQLLDTAMSALTGATPSPTIEHAKLHP